VTPRGDALVVPVVSKEAVNDTRGRGGNVRKAALLAATCVLALAGCEPEPVGVRGDLTPDERQALGVAVADFIYRHITGEEPATGSVAADEPDPLVTASLIEFHYEFTIRRACPLGGSVLIEGTRSGTGDPETRSRTVDTQATHTQEDCSFRVSRERVVTTTGAPNVVVTSHRAVVNGQLSGLQTMSMHGAFTWTSGEDEGLCEISIEWSFDPETRTRTVTGTSCGRPFMHMGHWQDGHLGDPRHGGRD
jgi:hypothetical protein